MDSVASGGGVMSGLYSVRGRGARGKEHIGIAPVEGGLWSRTICGLTCLPQHPAVWADVPDADKCWNCKVFHEIDAVTS